MAKVINPLDIHSATKVVTYDKKDCNICGRGVSGLEMYIIDNIYICSICAGEAYLESKYCVCCEKCNKR